MNDDLLHQIATLLATAYLRHRRRVLEKSTMAGNQERPLAVSPNQSVHGGRTSPEGDTNHCPEKHP